MGLGAQQSDLHTSGLPDPEHRSERIRVCHLIDSLGSDSLAESLLEASELMDRSRFEVSFLALNGLGVVAAELTRAGFQVEDIGASVVGKAKALHRLGRFFKQQKIDVVHTHNTSAQFHGAIAGKWSGVPGVFCTQHGHGCGVNRRSLWQFRIANEFTDRVFGATKATTTLCRQQNRTNAAKIQCVPDGVDLDKFFFYGPQDELRAITIAKFEDQYQLPNLIRGARKVVDSYPHFKLKILGDSPEGVNDPAARPLVDLAQRLHLKHHVQFLDPSADLARVLSSAGFFVSAAETTDANHAILQAMATGLPLLIPKSADTSEFITPGQNGRVMAGTDSDRIGFGMLSMITERPMWTLYGDESRRKVEENFNLKKTISTYEFCYIEIAQSAVR